MKNSRGREWGWILFSITFLAMSTAHTAAATEVEVTREAKKTSIKAVSGSFDDFLQKGAVGQQYNLPIQSLQANVSYTNAYNLYQSSDFGEMFEELKKGVAALLVGLIPESSPVVP